MSIPGYKIYPQQIPASLIDEVLSAHEKFKTNSFSSFRAQGTPIFEKPIINEFGNQINSIHNPHLLTWSGLGEKVKPIIYHRNISKCLDDFFSSNEDYIHYTSMLFDKSTATTLHQDSWFLDTNPRGRLAGVWIALEDITEEAGPFYVIENTDSKLVSMSDYDFLDINHDTSFNQDYPNANTIKFLARKGDILIWNSLLFHGAFKPKNKSLTRKSITSHYYQSSQKTLEQPVKRFLSIYDHKNPKPTINEKIKSATTINPAFFSATCYAMLAVGNKVSSLITQDHKHDKKLSKIRNIDD